MKIKFAHLFLIILIILTPLSFSLSQSSEKISVHNKSLSNDAAISEANRVLEAGKAALLEAADPVEVPSPKNLRPDLNANCTPDKIDFKLGCPPYRNKP